MTKLAVLLLCSCLCLTACQSEAPEAETPVDSQTTAVEETAVPPVEPVPVEEVVLPLTGHIICIDPGHCITPEAGKGHRELVSPLSTETKALYSTGTQGQRITEVALNLDVGLRLRDRLEALGATVIMTRTVSELTITGIERCEIAHRAGAEVNIHLHADGATDASVQGLSVLVPKPDALGTPAILADSLRLGDLMLEQLLAQTGAKSRGISPRADMTSFNFSQVPSILIEMGFLTNPEEEARLIDPAYQDKLVEGMAQALLQWYEQGTSA